MKRFALLLLVCIFYNPTNARMIDSLKTLIKDKDSAGVTNLISKHPEILDEKDENQTSGFLLLAYSGFKEAFGQAKLLKKDFSFHEAIVAGKKSIVESYLQDNKGLNNERSADGFSPLSLAAFFDQTELAILLLDNGAKPNLQAANPSKVNALHSAVAKENYELCALLIQHGVDVNVTQMQGVTALHSAAHRGNLKLVQLLVEAGADVNKRMDNGDTALSIAERDKHNDVIAYLKQQQ